MTAGDPPMYPAPDGVPTLVAEIDGAEKRFALADGVHEVGSRSGCDVHLDVPGVSRRHARLEVKAGRVTVEDLGSKNGTRVDGSTLDGPQELPMGSQLRIGPVHLRLDIGPRDEAEIGLALEPGPADVEPRDPDEPTGLGTTLSHRTVTGPRPAGPAGALVAFVEELAASSASLLEVVQGAFDAAGVAVVEVDGDSEEPTSVLGAAGLPGPWPALDGSPTEPCFVAGEGYCWGRLPYEDGGALALVVWQGAAEPRTAEHLTRITLAWLAHLEEERAFAPRYPAFTPDLEWPEDHVQGRSPAMVELYDRIRQVADQDVPVLVLGETGTGKEHVALMLHLASGRSGKLVAVNCAAIPEELLEAELFGIKKGVATGVRERIGKFQEAQGGTLFLDEIGDLGPSLQAKLLRVLQERIVRPLGGEPVQLDVRVVSATHAPLRDEGTFRRDLFFRLAGFELVVPPLRERPEDLAALVRAFARRACERSGKEIRGFSVAAYGRLQAYPWPGNVRELEHEIRRAVLICPDGETVTSDMLSEGLRETSPEPEGAEGPLLEPRLRELERKLIEEALEATHGNQTRAAERLGISRNGLLHRLKKLDISSDEFRRH